jgi:hypothetical protein
MYAWKTYDDLLEMYHKNKAAVKELVDTKFGKNQYRYHPEFPGNDDYMQYYVLIEASSTHDNIQSSIVAIQGEQEVRTYIFIDYHAREQFILSLKPC